MLCLNLRKETRNVSLSSLAASIKTMWFFKEKTLRVFHVILWLTRQKPDEAATTSEQTYSPARLFGYPKLLNI
jgi:hypothetical protein